MVWISPLSGGAALGLPDSALAVAGGELHVLRMPPR
jgi:hypothetical protein